MAKTCGLRIGPRGYELVLLEGGAKKHKVVASEVGELSFIADPEGAVEVLKDLAKRHEIPKDGLRVIIEGGQAAFRKVNLPINDDDKIEKVIKFEVEGELPQFNIEDVVVDWTRLSSTKDSCSLLTTIVKKEYLQGVLDVCERGGVEPIEVDADTSAIVNATAAAGALDPESACLIVFVGEESSSIAVIDGEELREFRSIKQGAMTHIQAPVAQEGEDLDGDAEGEIDEEQPIDEEQLIDEEQPIDEEQLIDEEPADVASSAIDSEEQRQQVLARMQRELARSVSGARTLQPIQRIIVAGYDMPGLIGSEVLDVPIEALTGLPDTTPSASRCAAAYGAAVAQLGGGLVTSNLRREELRFTGTLERLELPLAVAGLLLVTLLGVWNISESKKFDRVNDAVRYWRDSSVAFMYPEQKHVRGNMDAELPWLYDYTQKTTGEISKGLYHEDEVRSRHEQMLYMRQKLKQEVVKLRRELGQGGDITQPQSALKGVTYVLDILDDTKEEGARPSLRYVKSTYNRGSGQRKDSVLVVLDVTFFAEDTTIATEHFEAFQRKVESQEWHVEFSPVRTDELANGEGISVERIQITMDVSKIEEPTS